MSHSNIIDNIAIRSFNFKTIAEVCKFTNLYATEQSNYYTDLIYSNIRLISDDILYYYNTNQRIWLEINKEQFKNFTYNFFYEHNKRD